MRRIMSQYMLDLIEADLAGHPSPSNTGYRRRSIYSKIKQELPKFEMEIKAIRAWIEWYEMYYSKRGRPKRNI